MDLNVWREMIGVVNGQHSDDLVVHVLPHIFGIFRLTFAASSSAPSTLKSGYSNRKGSL